MEIIPRSEWRARPPRAVTPLPAAGLQGLAIHWSASAAPKLHGDCASAVRGFQNFHMDGHGWNDIAYSHLVCPHGHVYEGRGFGVRTAANGTNPGNSGYHAVCVIAGPGDVLPLAVESGLRAYRAEYVRRYPKATLVVPHHALFPGTQCPGELIDQYVAGKRYLPAAEKPTKFQIRYEVRAGISGKRRSLGNFRLPYLLAHLQVITRAVSALRDGESVVILRRKVAL